MREMARQCASRATRHGLQPSLYLWTFMLDKALPGSADSDLTAISLSRPSAASSVRPAAGGQRAKSARRDALYSATASLSVRWRSLLRKLVT